MAERTVYETRTFRLVVPERPHIPRADGGHLIIKSREQVFSSRADLSPAQAVEFIRLSMMAGEAMAAVLNRRGVAVGRINYQENGNWALRDGKTPFFHLHLYGRTMSARTQTWGEALVFPNPAGGFYDGFEPLSEQDAAEIRAELQRLAQTERYNTARWRAE